MRASFKKRLKWYGGIFFIASLVFGVNIFQYDKVKDTYNTKKNYGCNKKYFFAMQRDIKPTMADQFRQGLTPFVKKVNPYESMGEPTKNNPIDPRNGLSKAQIAEAESKYQVCLDERKIELQEATSKKERTEISLGIGGGLMALTAFLALVDFIVFLVRNRKLKIKTGEVMPMENKKITKIAILSFIVWGIISFLIAQSGYRHKFHVDTFLMLNIPSLLIVGYLWIADKFTLK